MIPTDRGFDPVQAAYNLTRKNPAVDWEIEMLTHLKNGNFDGARKCGVRAAEINEELAKAPEVDAKSATEHLIKAASLLEQVREYARAAQVYADAVAKDPNPGTRLVEGVRVTSPLRQFDLELMAGHDSHARGLLQKAAKAAEARHGERVKAGKRVEALDDSEFIAEAHEKLRDAAAAGEWRRTAAEDGAAAGEALRANVESGRGDPYEVARAAFERGLTNALLLNDDKLLIALFRRLSESEAKAARTLAAKVNEKWDAFRPMEFLMEAGVHFTVLGDVKAAGEMLALAEPLVLTHWKDQRGPTYYKLRAHLAIIAGHRDQAEEWRNKYRAEFERKERFSDDVAKPIHLEFDEEFYRMLGDEAAYRKTLVEICRTLEPGMREVFEGVDRMIEEGLFVQARKPLDELGLESKDQRIWRLLSAYVNWRAKVDAKTAREGDPKAFEDHMWHEIHPFRTPRQGLQWAAVMETLGAEEDPIDLYPLPRALDLIHGRRAA